MKWHSIIQAVVCIGLTSCTSTLIVNKEYHMGNHSPGNLGITIKGDRFIRYSGSVEPEFGPGDTNALIWAFFKKQLVDDIKRTTLLTEVNFDTCATDAYLKEIVIEVNRQPQSMYIPRDEGIYRCGGGDRRFVLILSDVSIKTLLNLHLPKMGPFGILSIGGIPEKQLCYSAVALLWDNMVKKPILYGQVSYSTSGFLPRITMTEWTNVSDGFTKVIFKKTPLYK